jgi:hypothetical protein
MPHAATKQISRIPHALTLATFLFLVVTLATLLPSSSHAQSPNDSDFSPSPTDVPPQKKRLPTAPPINLPSTGSGGLFPTSDPLAHPESLSLTAALVGAGLVAALAAFTVLASHRARREPPLT